MTPTSSSRYSNQRLMSAVPPANPLSMISLNAIGMAEVAAAAVTSAIAAHATWPG